VIIRPLGDVVVLMPPLAISEADLGRLVAVTAASIAEVSAKRAQVAA
jgi:adenosylmethionine-8-amino-7-oxononanoate aminotransferase